MDYIKVTVPALPETLDEVGAALCALGLDSFQTEDERDVLAQSPHWEMTDEALLAHYKGACRVIVYLPREDAKALAALRALFPDAATETVREEDWAENWKQFYTPIEIGRLVIHPEWLPLGDYAGRAVYLSNPGVSFGTGIHASTRLCLEILAAADVSGARVLDVGCGSGILGLCALLLGAREVSAVDIDPLAAGIALKTARLNGLSDRVRTFTGDFANDARLRGDVGAGFDLIFSNIVADIILALMPHIPPLLNPGGIWIVSGIIDTRAPEVARAASDAGLAAERREKDGWVAFKFKKGKATPAI
ncbi:MAG: 50S ribosomal protein L11 methyltransferase [Oscillospiraceae bacterium]|nr:50S ribosomal protein L11 methyltransferase [Oscillospiraceae bacterium]